MLNNFAGILLALASFAITFSVARLLRKWLKEKQARKDEAAALQGQSRQVRRAKARSAKG
jgi:hypothetical protein